jgi:peptide chain release factor 1
MRLTQDRLFRVLDRFDEIDARLSVCSDGGEIMRLSKERSSLAPVADAIRALEKARAERGELEQMILDLPNSDEMAQMAQAELEVLRESIPAMEQDLQILLLPKDADDEADVILEVRAGTGGDEAALFAGDLYRMYMRYFQDQKWEVEVVDETPGSAGGYSKIILEVSGDNVYGRLKFESGAHRVQRIPETEAKGRVHTSAATVVVMPKLEMEDVDIRKEDIRTDVFRASGAGGQHVNKTESGVRFTHLPTGAVAESTESRSQHKNRDIAMGRLIQVIRDAQINAHNSSIASARRSLVGTGDRSEKIRTYNWPQNRVTDHRLEGDNKNFNLDKVVEGDLEGLIQALIIADNAAKLQEEAA